MNCSKCGNIINPISGTNYGTKAQPICEKCAALQSNKYEDIAISKSKPICINHPNAKAEFTCRICGSPICKTCVFEFNDNIYICPNCVNKPQPLSPIQKKNLRLSYIMAGVATVGFALNIIMNALFQFEFQQNEEMQQIIGYLLLILVLLLSILGISRAVRARFRHNKNPTSLWLAFIWNFAFIVFFLLSTFVNFLLK